VSSSVRGNSSRDVGYNVIIRWRRWKRYTKSEEYTTRDAIAWSRSWWSSTPRGSRNFRGSRMES